MKVIPETTSEKYIFSESDDLEKERMDRLNMIYNPYSQSVMSQYIYEGMSVLEIGVGYGQMGEWIYQKIGKKGHYTALDINNEHLQQIKTKLQNCTVICASVIDIDKISELKNKTFDLIYFRWTLAYTAQPEFIRTLAKIYRYLNPAGVLISEECDLYKAYCSRNENQNPKISLLSFNKWLQLSYDIENTEGIDADFALGSKLHSLLVEATPINTMHNVTRFQPQLDNRYKKEIMSLAMRGSLEFLAAKKIKKLSSSGFWTKPELENLTKSIEKDIIENENISVSYLENTAICSRKPIMAKL